ncbi:hypothetical protein SteCoe_897 [Stentor coeruleus]|uniref:NADH:ubiquinone oxidoreductase intermediate-associated protein 30 domain-containing protein n=1 Tax=Stentor coeruleus TaxID=5963 RepID=A0A1R2D353_9CILI|nr:hypothetical protein SteCoe_897 [Stentor coeruleus]
MKNKSEYPPITIGYIGSEEDIFAWELDTDFRVGGNSIASIEMKKGYLNFFGTLQNFKELDYQDKLYCEVLTSMLVQKTFRKYNGLRIEVKTDGNQYVLGLIVKQNMSQMNYVGLIEDKSLNWVTLELPLSNFVFDDNIERNSVNYDFELFSGIKLCGISLGIYSHDQKQGKFEVNLKSIKMIYKEEFSDLNSKYPFPIMFKSILVDSVDTGKEKIPFSKPNDLDKFLNSR